MSTESERLKSTQESGIKKTFPDAKNIETIYVDESSVITSFEKDGQEYFAENGLVQKRIPEVQTDMSLQLAENFTFPLTDEEGNVNAHQTAQHKANFVNKLKKGLV